MKINFIKLLLVISVITSLNIPSFSCTLWSSDGSSSKDGNTLISKNRDWKPDNKQILKKIDATKNDLAFLGLFAEDNDDPGVKAGINEKGVVAITASASSIPVKERNNMKDKRNLLRKLLTRYDSVDAIIKDQKIFSNSRPVFYMIADEKKIAYIEVAMDSRYSIKEMENGVLYHTNHYIDNDLSYSNIKIGKSSLARYERIKKLLTNGNKQLSLEDFLKISNDRSNGPDNSIWRTGSKEDSERTLASWIVEIPKNDPPVVYVKTANPGEPEKEYKITIDDKFWKNKFDK